MLIKKLAAPFVNNKVLHEAEYCYIATAAISEAGFDFVRTRVSPRCKIAIVTGLDMLTSPNVLKRIWKHYLDRIDLRIYTRNFFHANVYIFDLPFRKSVAFTGSGTFTLEGLKDHEEIFTKTIDPKDIEELKSWFTGYFEFAEPLTEEMIAEYELIYPAMKQREIASREEKEQFIEIAGRGFSWDSIKFKTQYFKKEDYLVLSNAHAAHNTEELREARETVGNKLLQLHDAIHEHLATRNLHAPGNTAQIVSSLNPAHHPGQKIRSITLAYGQKDTALPNDTPVTATDFMTMQVVLLPKNVGIRLLVGAPGGNRVDRAYFQRQMLDEEYRNAFFKLLTALAPGYWIAIAGEKRAVETFKQEAPLWEFTKADDWRYYTFVIGKDYSPGDPAIGTETIAPTVTGEFDKLITLYRHIKEA